jgi:spermidine/putrescine transport system ATP-binding protein
MSDRIAVMEGGVVQQVDEPRSLYERPETSFVADFIGTSNLLSFAGASRTNGVAALDLGEGMRIVGPDDAGDWITVRPEKVRIGVELDGDCSRVGGTVVETVYLGSLSQTVVELVTGERLIVHELNDDEHPAREPGDAVTVTWHARHSLLLDEVTEAVR